MAGGATSLRSTRWVFPADIPAFLLLMAGLGLLTAGALEWIYADRIWPGVFIGGVDVGGLTEAEARARWEATLPDPQRPLFTLRGPGFQQVVSLADLGARVDVSGTLREAMQAGRGNGLADGLDRIRIWWWGRVISPRVEIEVGLLEARLAALATAIDRAPRDASLEIRGDQVIVHPAEAGARLDREALRARLLEALATLQPQTIDLPVETVPPALTEVEPARTQLSQWLQAPVRLFVPTETLTVPLSLPEAGPWELSPADLAQMVTVVREDSPTPRLVARLEEARLLAWLTPITRTLQADPVDARFIFNEAQRQLVPVAPARWGYRVEIPAMVARIRESLSRPTREVPIALTLIPPRYPETITAEALRITGRIAEATTNFKGSPPPRVRNITLGASRMHGVVVPPGEVFSFNAHLGDVSVDTGFEEALIIFNGRTVRGVGGGLCQVSTTLFRAAFFGGFPIEERWPHAYRVGWYERTFGPGLDAAIFSPYADFKFRNDRDTPILIVAEVNSEAGTLTFKIYGSNDGRTVTVEGPFVSNVVPHGPPVYEEDPSLPKGKVVQVEWAVDGADVLVKRKVERNGQILYEDRVFTRYQAWRAVFKVGTGEP
ncbi:VanW family protein [Thermoflexus sp.]|uniref:VanW family protein n=1 Tax=Thermoflexus sp. TaxID=1969742 RepID=UPI0025DDECCD|nr:VanW family protein [Thermoflexus sp.]MCS7351290.1 VanW family protein [Thermoflexus sp.]MCX7690936.1 VanW family protein [Thermoflexus sp.]MDW8180744.1 VanW family protein [Anaerolineae bacterium]